MYLQLDFGNCVAISFSLWFRSIVAIVFLLSSAKSDLQSAAKLELASVARASSLNLLFFTVGCAQLEIFEASHYVVTHFAISF